MKHKIIIVIAFLSFLNVLTAQTEEFSKELYIKGKDTLKYRMLLPKNFSENNQYPVILFLHGSGERGNDNEAQLVHGSKLFLNETVRDSFPAIVIFPQCPKEDYWANATVDRTTKPIGLNYPLEIAPTKALELVMDLVDSFLLETYVNKDKIYVGGLSMGGMGTFEILYRRPDIFAAAFPICGAGNPEATKLYATKTPIWIFHGAQDDVVNPQSSIDMVSAILKNGGTPNFTLYGNDNHNSWDSALAEPNLLPWLFSNSKN